MISILVVDDEAMNRELIGTILSKEVYNLTFAESGEECLEKISQYHYNLLLLDLMMPVIDGFTVLQQLRLLSHEKIVDKIIVISALNDKDSIIKALALGADDYLVKPFDMIDLKSKIKRNANLRELQTFLGKEWKGNKKGWREVLVYYENDLVKYNERNINLAKLANLCLFKKGENSLVRLKVMQEALTYSVTREGKYASFLYALAFFDFLMTPSLSHINLTTEEAKEWFERFYEEDIENKTLVLKQWRMLCRYKTFEETEVKI